MSTGELTVNLLVPTLRVTPVARVPSTLTSPNARVAAFEFEPVKATPDALETKTSEMEPWTVAVTVSGPLAGPCARKAVPAVARTTITGIKRNKVFIMRSPDSFFYLPEIEFRDSAAGISRAKG